MPAFYVYISLSLFQITSQLEWNCQITLFFSEGQHVRLLYRQTAPCTVMHKTSLFKQNNNNGELSHLIPI